MSMYRAMGKQVLFDGRHFADACSPNAAMLIANAMNGPPRAVAEYAIEQLHIIARQSDEYACSCGARWSVDEGEEHP